VGHDSLVSIATRYVMDDQRIESRWGQGFPHPSREAVRPTQTAIKWVPGLLPEVKRPWRGVDRPFNLAPRLKKECSYKSAPLWAFMTCSRMNSTLMQSQDTD
jgi:hypothetical protein